MFFWIERSGPPDGGPDQDRVNTFQFSTRPAKLRAKSFYSGLKPEIFFVSSAFAHSHFSANYTNSTEKFERSSRSLLFRIQAMDYTNDSSGASSNAVDLARPRRCVDPGRSVAAYSPGKSDSRPRLSAATRRQLPVCLLRAACYPPGRGDTGRPAAVGRLTPERTGTRPVGRQRAPCGQGGVPWQYHQWIFSSHLSSFPLHLNFRFTK